MKWFYEKGQKIPFVLRMSGLKSVVIGLNSKLVPSIDKQQTKDGWSVILGWDIKKFGFFVYCVLKIREKIPD
jgi:hypothetical protein